MNKDGTGMVFTGERFVPEARGDIELEHLHRYLQACEIATGKTVLDMASGEGYGSAMLANVAEKVIGVDISAEAVQHARKRYPKENLTYMVGNCADVPLPDASVDLVVSFETIEHHDRHQEMMREIKRVLRPEGLLLISSPDRYYYSIEPEYQNPFHVKELYEHEFKQLLECHFKNTSYYGQRVLYASAILAKSSTSPVVSYRQENGIIKNMPGSLNPVYWIALASDVPLPELAAGLLEQPLQEAEPVVERDRQIKVLKQVVADRDRLLADRDRHIIMLNAERIAERTLILNSTSWWITRPLRTLSRFVQRRQLSRLPAKINRVYQDHGIAGVWHKAWRKLRQRGRQDSGTLICQSPAYMHWLRNHDTLTDTARQAKAVMDGSASTMQLISVVMPTYNSRLEWLEEAIASVQNQTYPHWQLCIADDASTHPEVRQMLEHYSVHDPRIQVLCREINGHISAATNSALTLATGDFVCFLDHDDRLHPDALLELAGAVLLHPDVDILYTDEDKLLLEGERCLPFFKPDWSPHLAVSQAWLGHLVCYRAGLVKAVGGLRQGFEGAQDYDLWLRASLLARAIVHIPRVLYHWRLHAGSTALVADSKPYAHNAGRRAVEEYLGKRYPDQQSAALDGEFLFTYQAKFDLPSSLLISIIIPTRDGLELLRSCVESILSRSTWKNYEILILDNGSTDPAMLDYLRAAPANYSQLRVISLDIPFNWSRLNNLGAEEAKGDLFVFLNNDTRVISPDWLEQLAGYALLPDVGVVGGLLLFEDGTIQHSGVVVGMKSWADHLFRGLPMEHTRDCPFISPMLTRNVLAVTGACLAIERDKFTALGGYSEDFIICGSDVEFCLRAHRQGYYNVLAGQARLYHLESKTRTSYIPEEDFKQSEISYKPYRTQQTDPFYNPNLSLETTTPILRD
jgi:GT2 family glycosyltransferase/SAM-dependent methyltransferase